MFIIQEKDITYRRVGSMPGNGGKAYTIGVGQNEIPDLLFSIRVYSIDWNRRE